MDREKLLEICIQKRNKEIDLSWNEINDKYGDFVNGEALRCWVKEKLKKEGKLPTKTTINLEKIELQKERVRIREERNEFNKIIKESAKRDSLKDSIIESAKLIAKEKPLINIKSSQRKTGKTGILQLSDWHFALTTSNFNNDYNIDIFNQRINKLVAKALDECLREDIEELYILVQGDLISSNIHDVLRVKNQTDVISQIIKTSEVLAEIITEFANYFKVKICLVSDNHSRATLDKNENIEEENYMRITKWHLETRLKNHKCVEILNNTYGSDISDFEIYGFKALMIHGHLEKNFKNTIASLSTYTRNIYDFIFTAHLHHLIIEELTKTTIIANGCLSGVDDHSHSLRLSSYPTQNLVIISKTGDYKIYPIRVSL